MNFCMSQEFDLKKYEYAKRIEGAEVAKPAKPRTPSAPRSGALIQ